MSVAENISLVKQAIADYNERGTEGIAEFMAETVTDFFASGREPLRGKRAFVDDNIAFAGVFEDLHVGLTNIFGQDDWVCLQGVMTGVHKGPFPAPGGRTIPATGNHIRIPICNIVKLENGKIAEIHEYFDSMAFLAQIDAL